MPPGVKKSWDECDVWTQAKIIAFYQLLQYEEMEEKKAMLGKPINKTRTPQRRTRRSRR